MVFNSISPKVSIPLGFSIKPKANILDSRLRGNDSGGGGGIWRRVGEFRRWIWRKINLGHVIPA
ncbi:MAG: hypothetical protein HAW59_04525 [Betaproteobacteria bacterium]|nr:hypothetical protein [Betaproteobacteria bacterium]